VRPRTAKGETKIEGTKLDILEKKEPSATIAADTRESKEEQARERLSLAAKFNPFYRLDCELTCRFPYRSRLNFGSPFQSGPTIADADYV